MNPRSKIAAVIAACTVIGISALFYVSYIFQNDRVHKIDFILWDREHENIAHLTDSDLIRYVEVCGATTAKSEGHRARLANTGAASVPCGMRRR